VRHIDAVTVEDERSQVHCIEVGISGRATSGEDRLLHTGIAGNLIDPGTQHSARYVDDERRRWNRRRRGNCNTCHWRR
jgi:hypothetical protein